MLRAIAVIVAAGACVLAGCRGAIRLKRRYTALGGLCDAMQRIRLQIAHTNCRVPALLNECGEGETQPFFSALAKDIAAGCTPLDAWERAAAANVPLLEALTQNDKNALAVFFSLLGGSDRRSQLMHVDATRRQLSMQCAEAKRLSDQNGRVYRTLGVLLGAGVAILML